MNDFVDLHIYNTFLRQYPSQNKKIANLTLKKQIHSAKISVEF